MRKFLLVTTIVLSARFAASAQILTIDASAAPASCIFNNVVYATSALPINNCMQLIGNMFPVNGGLTMTWPDMFTFNGGLGGWAVMVNPLVPTSVGKYENDHFFLDCGGGCSLTADIAYLGGGCYLAPPSVPVPPCMVGMGLHSVDWILTGPNSTILIH